MPVYRVASDFNVMC